MRCPCCDWSLEQRGENREDFHCCNPKCLCRKEANYYPHVGVRENWWFATQYHLPFKRGMQWYCVKGPDIEYYVRDKNSLVAVSAEELWPWGTAKYAPRKTTVLQKITPSRFNLGNSGIYYHSSSQEKIWSIDYMALPVNEEDFNKEFNVLLSKFDRYLNKLMVLVG